VRLLHNSNKALRPVGNPGWGKSVLAASTVQELLLDRDASRDIPSHVICYHFFSHETPDTSSRIGAHRALLAQLFQQCNALESIRSAFALIRDEAGDVASERELLDLLKLCLTFLPNTTFILDGFDECSENSFLFRDYSNLVGGPHFNIAIFSRPQIACLRRPWTELQIIPMSRDILDADIAIYLRREIQELQSNNLIPSGVDNQVPVQDLLDRAEGMFLWARLMTTYLNSLALTPKSRLEAIRKISPGGLKAMYSRIFRLIQEADEPSQKLAAVAFMWVAHGRTGLTARELEEAYRDATKEYSEADLLPDVEGAVLLSCAGLLEKRFDNTIRFIHLTARDFILLAETDSPGQPKYIQSGSEAEASMATRCLQYLLYTVPAQPLKITAGSALPSQCITKMLPFLRYSCSYGLSHLCRALALPASQNTCEQMSSLIGVANVFLKARLTLMVWLEALFTCAVANSTLTSIVADLMALRSGLSYPLQLSAENMLKDLQDFVNDISAIVKAWEQSLKADPSEIWNDVTAFTPSRFFVQTSASSVQRIKSCQEVISNSEERPMFTVSKTSVGMTQLAVLSIWPSR
jgi:hypothetical protein